MALTTVLQKIIKSEQAGENWSVFCLYGSAYQPFFISSCIERFKKASLPVVSLDLSALEPSQVMAELSMSFLGQNKVYWCGDLGALDADQKKFFVPYFKEYRGPHQIICFSDSPINEKKQGDKKQSSAALAAEIPLSLDQDGFVKLCRFFDPESALDADFIKQIFSRQPKMTLDQACRVMQYLQVMGDANHDAVQGLLQRVVEPEHSLFVLSQHFFAKDQQAFFKLWQAVEPDFPPEFWIPFWSEQLWQASLFVMQAQQAGPAGAKKGITRLPFSFMQRDWKRYGVRELCAAHTFLYGIDFGLKNGYAEHGLELFVSQFLQGTFAKR